jgi:putative serine protease PepD
VFDVRMSRVAQTSASLLAAGVLAAGGAVGGYLFRGDSSQTKTVTAASPSAQPTAAVTTNVNRIWRSARGAVVEIAATTSAAGVGSQGGTAQGSGFVYDSAGHILTNNHVVDGADSVTVRFTGGKTARATVVATDASTDLAVLKVPILPSSAHALSLASSAGVAVGDPVVAIGSPFGLEGTVTTGIVSATGRDITAPDGYTITGTIQTDAAINHGNSGGPLLDASGRLIGVNAQIESDSGGNDGVGFAIPSDTVRRVATQLITNGAVKHAYLGVTLSDGNAAAHIEKVQDGSPARGAGVQAGDAVIEIDGTRVRSADDLRTAIESREPGTKVTLKILRGGEEKTLHVTLGQRPAA